MYLSQFPIRHIAVVIPAHNEEDSIADCLISITQSRDFLQNFLATNNLDQIQVSIIAVLDSCLDKTQAIVKKMQLLCPSLVYLTCEYRCVGQVRALGVQYAIGQEADWIACTDADSQVSKDWLVAQFLHLNDQYLQHNPCYMICGVVSVSSWEHLSATAKEKYLAHYQDQMDHRHIHGANLSFLVSSYQQVGGFTALPCHEDVDLVKKFEAAHLKILWSNQVRVITSSRLEARANEGFAHFLAQL